MTSYCSNDLPSSENELCLLFCFKSTVGTITACKDCGYENPPTTNSFVQTQVLCCFASSRGVSVQTTEQFLCRELLWDP